MRIILRSGAAALSGMVVLMGALSLVAQEASSPKAETTAPKAKKSDRTPRVPAYFGEIGLTPEQKESIYKVQAKHAAKIADLQKQITAARKEELAECETILTDTQKQLLEHRRRAAAEKIAAKKKAAQEKAAAETTKEETKTDAAQ